VTIRRAVELTRVRLRFGDRLQIEAVTFLSDIERLLVRAKADRWQRCMACLGKTYVAACDCGDCERDEWLESCGLCDETGVLSADAEPIPGFADINEDVRTAVIELLGDAELVEYVEALKRVAA
jgi:hypothetical protein